MEPCPTMLSKLVALLLSTSVSAILDLRAAKNAAFFKYSSSQNQNEEATRPTDGAAPISTPLLPCPWGPTPRDYHPGYKCEMPVGNSGDASESAEFLKSSFTGAIGIGTPPQVFNRSQTLNRSQSLHFLSRSPWFSTPAPPTCGCRARHANAREIQT